MAESRDDILRRLGVPVLPTRRTPRSAPSPHNEPSSYSSSVPSRRGRHNNSTEEGRAARRAAIQADRLSGPTQRPSPVRLSTSEADRSSIPSSSHAGGFGWSPSDDSERPYTISRDLPRLPPPFQGHNMKNTEDSEMGSRMPSHRPAFVGASGSHAPASAYVPANPVDETTPRLLPTIPSSAISYGIEYTAANSLRRRGRTRGETQAGPVIPVGLPGRLQIHDRPNGTSTDAQHTPQPTPPRTPRSIRPPASVSDYDNDGHQIISKAVSPTQATRCPELSKALPSPSPQSSPLKRRLEAPDDGDVRDRNGGSPSPYPFIPHPPAISVAPITSAPSVTEVAIRLRDGKRPPRGPQFEPIGVSIVQNALRLVTRGMDKEKQDRLLSRAGCLVRDRIDIEPHKLLERVPASLPAYFNCEMFAAICDALDTPANLPLQKIPTHMPHGIATSIIMTRMDTAKVLHIITLPGEESQPVVDQVLALLAKLRKDGSRKKVLFPNTKTVILNGVFVEQLANDPTTQIIQRLVSPTSICLDFTVGGGDDFETAALKTAMKPLHEAWPGVVGINFHRASNQLPLMELRVKHRAFFSRGVPPLSTYQEKAKRSIEPKAGRAVPLQHEWEKSWTRLVLSAVDQDFDSFEDGRKEQLMLHKDHWELHYPLGDPESVDIVDKIAQNICNKVVSRVDKFNDSIKAKRRPYKNFRSHTIKASQMTNNSHGSRRTKSNTSDGKPAAATQPKLFKLPTHKIAGGQRRLDWIKLEPHKEGEVYCPDCGTLCFNTFFETKDDFLVPSPTPSPSPSPVPSLASCSASSE